VGCAAVCHARGGLNFHGWPFPPAPRLSHRSSSPRMRSSRASGSEAGAASPLRGARRCRGAIVHTSMQSRCLQCLQCSPERPPALPTHRRHVAATSPLVRCCCTSISTVLHPHCITIVQAEPGNEQSALPWAHGRVHSQPRGWLPSQLLCHRLRRLHVPAHGWQSGLGPG